MIALAVARALAETLTGQSVMAAWPFETPQTLDSSVVLAEAANRLRPLLVRRFQ